MEEELEVEVDAEEVEVVERKEVEVGMERE